MYIRVCRPTRGNRCPGPDEHGHHARKRPCLGHVAGDERPELAQRGLHHAGKLLAFRGYPVAHAITTLPVSTPAALSFGHTLRNGSVLTRNGSKVPSPTLMTPSLASRLL